MTAVHDLDERDRVRGLAAVARVLEQHQPLPQLLEMAGEEAQVALRAASVSVSRVIPGRLAVRTIVNVGDLGPQEERWPRDESYEMGELAEVDPRVDRVVAWSWQAHDPELPEGERSLLAWLDKGSSLAAALVVDGALWGEVYATRHHGEPPFDDGDVAYLEAFLAILSGALSRVAREESLAHLAYHDPLTGLANRRSLDEATADAFTLGPGRSREIVVVVADINGLKQVNDTEGHAAGDRVIKQVAGGLLHVFAQLPGSLVARVGGDEFTVLVTDRPLARVVAIADDLVAESWAGASPCTLSCGAAGVVRSPGSPLRPFELFAAADRAQYLAKRGRLRTTVVATDVREGDGAPVPVPVPAQPHPVDEPASLSHR